MRIQGIDGMRALAAFAVVVVHTVTVPPEMTLLGIFKDQMIQFAVPFFFVASGYFYANSLSKKRTPHFQFKKTVSRLLFLYLFWSVVYFFNPPIGEIMRDGALSAYSARFAEVTADWRELLLVGPAFHLWFFNALLWAIACFYLFSGQKRIHLFLTISFGIYLFALLGNAYAKTSFGFTFPINTRNFLFFSLFPFTAGFWLYGKKGLSTHFYFGLALWAFATAMNGVETQLLRAVYERPFYNPPFVFFSAFTGIGAFIMGNSNHALLRKPALVFLGKLSLGIYVTHALIVVRVHAPLKMVDPSLRMILAPLIVFSLTSLLVYGMMRFATTRKLIA